MLQIELIHQIVSKYYLNYKYYYKSYYISCPPDFVDINMALCLNEPGCSCSTEFNILTTDLENDDLYIK